MPKTTIRWNTGNPPRRGAYRVRSDGPSPNHGWRYWFGDHWGPLCSRRSWAIENGKCQTKTRRARITRPILWGQVVNAEAEALELHVAKVRKHVRLGDIVTHIRPGGQLEEHQVTNLNWQSRGMLAGWATGDTRHMKTFGDRGHGRSGDAFNIHPARVTHINRLPVAMLR